MFENFMKNIKLNGFSFPIFVSLGIMETHLKNSLRIFLSICALGGFLVTHIH